MYTTVPVAFRLPDPQQRTVLFHTVKNWGGVWLTPQQNGKNISGWLAQ